MSKNRSYCLLPLPPSPQGNHPSSPHNSVLINWCLQQEINWLHDKFSAGSNKNWQRPQYDDTLFSLKAFPHPLRYLWTPILSFRLPFHLLRSKPPHRKHLPELGKVVGNFSWCYGRVWTEKEIWDLFINFWTFSSLACLALWPRYWKTRPQLELCIFQLSCGCQS